MSFTRRSPVDHPQFSGLGKSRARILRQGMQRRQSICNHGTSHGQIPYCYELESNCDSCPYARFVGFRGCNRACQENPIGGKVHEDTGLVAPEEYMGCLSGGSSMRQCITVGATLKTCQSQEGSRGAAVRVEAHGGMRKRPLPFVVGRVTGVWAPSAPTLNLRLESIEGMAKGDFWFSQALRTCRLLDHHV
jgi:hypothetical protein